MSAASATSRVSVWWWWLFLVVLAARLAAASETLEQFDARITTELAATHPEAVAAFTEANDARRDGDLQRAESLYEQVRLMAPGFDHAIRRLSRVKEQLGRRDEGIVLAREALAVTRSAQNLSSLAALLTTAPQQGGPSAEQLEEASSLVREARELRPADPDVIATQAEVAFVSRKPEEMRVAVRDLLELAPEDPRSHYLAALELGSRGEIEEGRAALAVARKLGLSDERYEWMTAIFDEATPWWLRAWRLVRVIVPAWIGGMLALLAGGLALSAFALKVAATPPSGGAVTSMPPVLRRAYRWILWLSCAYYYVSLPLLLLVIVGLGAAALVAVLSIGHVPVQLLVIIVVVVLVSVFAVLKGLLVRVRDDDPGERLDVAQHPRLDGVLREVAQRVGTPVVDDVFLTPGTELAVFERGGLSQRLRGTSRRCLILGAGILHGMSLLSFKSVLAHEYGHLTNRDTAGGGFALGVRNSMSGMAGALAENGAATWYNPAWWFVNAYMRIFLRISQGASRLQEVMADRWAAQCYGSGAFVDGLSHVVRRSVSFDASANVTIQRCIETHLPLVNLYAADGLPDDVRREVSEAQERALAGHGSPYDSHPRPADRIAWVQALAVPAPSGEDPGAEDAWSLLTDRRSIEERMTAHVRRMLAGVHGVEIAGPRHGAASG